MKPLRVNVLFGFGLIISLGLFAANALAQASFGFNVASPAVGSFSGDNLYVQVSISATYEVKSVTASVADRTTNLVDDANLGWVGNLSLAGLTRGTQTLTIVATDFFSNSGQTQISFVRDLPPVLTVIEPATALFARPRFRVRASATDDDPNSVVIKVNVLEGQGSRLLATATNTLDAVVDISELDGYLATLEFDAKDSVGQNVATRVNVYVCSNTNVVEVDRVNGGIRDVSPDRILFTEGNNLISKSRLTGTETVLVNRPDFSLDPALDQAFLTPHGAIFSKAGELYEARDGTNVDLGFKRTPLIVKGNYAIWSVGMTLTLRDLLAGANVVISANRLFYDYDVASNGDVVYSPGGAIFRYRSGISTPVGNGVLPLTDGVNVGYFKGDAFPWPDFTLVDGTNEIILGPRPNVDSSRALNAGWTAFTKPGTGGTTQAWTRSPWGVQSQRTFFGDLSDLILQGLAPNGDIMFIRQVPNRLYFVSGLAAPKDFGPWFFGVQPFWIDGNWYALMGGSLVNIVVPSRAAISTPTWAPTAQFSFHVSAGIGQQIITQKSSDLFTWVSVGTNYVTNAGSLDVTVPAAGNSTVCFYRIVSVQ